MIQDILVFLLFVLAVGYVARLLYKSFTAKGAACAKGCGSCGALDPAKLEALIKGAEKQHHTP